VFAGYLHKETATEYGTNHTSYGPPKADNIGDSKKNLPLRVGLFVLGKSHSFTFFIEFGPTILGRVSSSMISALRGSSLCAEKSPEQSQRAGKARLVMRLSFRRSTCRRTDILARQIADKPRLLHCVLRLEVVRGVVQIGRRK
jgi:hypothetical protein